MSRLEKAYAISNAKISFVSLVDKAANKRQFLITKAQDGQATFEALGRIIKADPEAHYVTGIVYEPLTEDAHGNYMTEEEITKAAYAYAESGAKVDLQHSFESLDGASVVESYVTKCDMELEGVPIKKGTWMMTVKVENQEVYKAIEKGEITGFSMGGVGSYSTVDDELPVEKQEEAPPQGFWSWLKKQMGLEQVEKGVFSDKYRERAKQSNFWTAFHTLEDVLYHRNFESDRWEFLDDEDTIRQACMEFSNQLTAILTGGQPIINALEAGPVEKAGKAMSSSNRKTLQSIYDNLGAFLGKFEEESEESDMSITKEDLTSITQAVSQSVTEAIQKAMGTNNAGQTAPAAATQEAPAQPVQKQQDEGMVSQEAIQEMIAKTVDKHLHPEKYEQPTAENIQKMIDEAVKKALEPVMQAAGVPHDLSSTGDGAPITKSQEDEAYYSMFA